MSLSLKKGDQIFRIKGGKNSGKKIKLNDSDKKSSSDFDEFETEGLIQHIPSRKKRSCLYICGPSGAGKSTYAANFCKEYKKQFPNNNIVLFCPKHDDPVINKLNPIKIKLNEENLIDKDEKITLDELKDSICIFDDTEGIADNKIKKAVMELRDQILTLGRSKNISCVTISHLVTDNKNTKAPIVESNFFTFFPGGGLNYQVMRFLRAYCGLAKKQIDKIMGLRSRWVTIHKSYPMFVITKDQAFIIK